MANSPDLQMYDLICERDQLLRDVASRNSMLDRLNASNERLAAENADMKAAMWRLCHEALDLYGGGSEQTVRMRIEMEMKISAVARADAAPERKE